MKKIVTLKILFFVFAIFMNSCTEPYALQTNTFENAIVIEATLTNELKKQEIKISRTLKFEESDPKIEDNAIVYIRDDSGNQYNFEQTEDKYTSINEFQAMPNRNYQLFVITKDGKSYTSTKEKLTTISPITDVIPEQIIKDNERGVQISVKSYDPNFSSKYYRYEYEETYKIIAPKWVSQKAIINGPQSYAIVPRTVEAKTCYSTINSDEIIIANTNNQQEDRINIPIRFISNKNYIITHRYSILVKQYIQNLQAHTFYATLKKLSNSGNILSQNQPGFFSGNIKCDTNPNEKVIGFFDVSSVSEKRIFFNYENIFPGELPPPYITDCNLDPNDPSKYHYLFCFVISPSIICSGNTFMQSINDNRISYYTRDVSSTSPINDDIIAFDIKCGDCTSFSSNLKPLFWID